MCANINGLHFLKSSSLVLLAMRVCKLNAYKYPLTRIVLFGESIIFVRSPTYPLISHLTAAPKLSAHTHVFTCNIFQLLVYKQTHNNYRNMLCL